MQTNGVHIRGAGIACALGRTVADSLSRLRDAVPAPTCVSIDNVTEPHPYYRIDDAAVLLDGERLRHLLPNVINAAVTDAGLPSTALHDLPIFIGSSCFSISLFEAEYIAALAQDPATAIAMPTSGYCGIDAIVRKALGHTTGGIYMYNTACSSSANALLAATRMIQIGWYRHALVIGAEIANRTSLAGFSGLQLIANALRPFDSRREGIVLGEGLGAVLLSCEPGEGDALRILGGASNCDTSSVSTANPNGHSIAAVLRDTLIHTDLPPAKIRAIKAHGTATPSGDAAEAAGLHAVFNVLPPVFGIKPLLGHTLGACGVVELALMAGALEAGFIPATCGFEHADPALGITPLCEPIAAPPGHYLFNHFGFGGNNTVLAVEKPA